MTRYSSDKNNEKKIALEHIAELFKEAENSFKADAKLSDVYVRKARDIQMKFRLRMPFELKKRFCKNCQRYLVPPLNCRVRISDGKIVTFCFSCKKYMRIPIKPKKQD